MPQRPPLYQQHIEAGAKIVDFAGWDLPIHYGSQVDEHHLVRRDAGMFDVSHMAHTEVTGVDATTYLRRLLANDVQKLGEDGRALYSCLLNNDGGVIDDLIVYRLATNRYRVISNAATRDKDLAWMREHIESREVTLSPLEGVAMLAVQGPRAVELACKALPADVGAAAGALARFQALETSDYFIGRTGYTGEDGFEIAVADNAVPALWQILLASGVAPAGLGARDTLRLEAGMALYGNDLDDGVTPFESNLAWTVDFRDTSRAFIGREVLAAQRRDGVNRQLVGLVLDARGVLRGHQIIFDGDRQIGEITSGGFSPTAGRSIALARLEHPCNTNLTVNMRGRKLAVKVVPLPFVKGAKSTLIETEETSS